MTADLSRRESELVSQSVGSTLLRLLAYPDATDATLSHVKGGMAGGSCLLGDVDGWCQVTAKGVGWSREIVLMSGPYELVVPWSRIVAHVDSRRTPDRQERGVRHFVESQAHALASPTYPSRHTQPELWEERERYWREVHMPEFRRLQAQASALVVEVLPLLVDDEPADLLELLAGQS